MKRIQFFEFSDLPWFPGFLRDYITDFLQFGANSFDIYKNIVPLLVEGLHKSKGSTLVDLASGGGGGMIRLARHLQGHIDNLKIILTDYYPNVAAFERTRKSIPRIFQYSTECTDARNVAADLRGLRTMFLAFHHFNPQDARKILVDAVQAQMPIAIFEVQQRDVKSMIPMVMSPLNVLLTTPFIKPFRPGRIVFTYLIPIVPLAIMFDGIISVLRTYSQQELREMIAQADPGQKFQWKMGTTKFGKRSPASVFYLVGYAK